MKLSAKQLNNSINVYTIIDGPSNKLKCYSDGSIVDTDHFDNAEYRSLLMSTINSSLGNVYDVTFNYATQVGLSSDDIAGFFDI